MPFVSFSLRLSPPGVFACRSVDDTETLALTTADSKSAALLLAVKSLISSDRDCAGIGLARFFDVGVLGSIWRDVF